MKYQAKSIKIQSYRYFYRDGITVGPIQKHRNKGVKVANWKTRSNGLARERCHLRQGVKDGRGRGHGLKV